MREIKFRGKRIDTGEWIYGDLIKDKDKYYIITTVGYVSDENLDFANKYLECFAYEVIPKTVGECIGLKDKNDNEIYKKDIVKVYCRYYNNEGYEEDYPMCDTGIVEFSNSMSYEIKMKDGAYSRIILDCKHTGEEFWFKVIGNIYENPELLS